MCARTENPTDLNVSFETRRDRQSGGSNAGRRRATAAESERGRRASLRRCGAAVGISAIVNRCDTSNTVRDRSEAIPASWTRYVLERPGDAMRDA